MALECDPGERVFGVVGRCDADDDAGIGVALPAGILAHAIGDNTARFGGRSHHGAAGAHAKTVDRAPIAAVMNQLVVSRSQAGMTRESTVTTAIDERLWMLDAQSNGERFWLDRNSSLCYHLERVACAVPDRQYHMVGRDLRAVAQYYPHNLPATVRPFVNLEIHDFASKAIFATE